MQKDNVPKKLGRPVKNPEEKSVHLNITLPPDVRQRLLDRVGSRRASRVVQMLIVGYLDALEASHKD